MSAPAGSGAAAAAGLAAAAQAGRRFAAWLGANLSAERERWPLWMPAGLGLGIAIYFALPVEPPLWPAAVLAAGGLALFVAARRRPGARGQAALAVLGLAVALVGAGLCAAKVRTLAVAAPVLESRLGPVPVRGRIAYAETLTDGRRIVLEKLRLPGVAPEETPARVRLRLPEKGPHLTAGQWAAGLAVLQPPPAPAAPGAYDFQRRAYFERLGAVGFTLGAPERAEPPPGAPPRADSWRIRLSGLRQEITTRVRTALAGREGAVAAALMTGERGAIPEPVLAAMRDSGLAHLLAISGLHIGLVAGILFFTVRGGLALSPAVALRFPVKKWAAVVALVGAFLYVVIAGATVPTQRAFVMAALVLCAVLLDRRAISMRLVAWAAVIVLLVNPASLLGPSFQMSFAAVVALVAVYEALAAPLPPGPGAFSLWGGTGDRGPTWRRRVAVYLGGIALTTIVATLATAPFAIFTFNRLAAYGLAANLVAVPLTALWIMPWAMVAFLLLPLGLEGLALAPMGAGLRVLLEVAETVAGWPGAHVLVPAMPMTGLVLVALGGLWLCLWRRRWRYLGLPVALAGLASVALVRPPDVLVDGDAKLMAVRAADGGLWLSTTRAERFRAGIWLRRAGREDRRAWPQAGTSPDGRLACDRLGCVYRAAGRTVALARDGRALADDCRAAAVVVATVPVRGPCPSARTVVDRFDIWRKGGHVLWLDGGAVRVETVRDWQGARPWVTQRGR